MSKQSDIVKVSQDAGTTGFVNTTGDTMTGTLSVTGGRLYVGQTAGDYAQFGKDTGGNAFIDATQADADFGIYINSTSTGYNKKFGIDSAGRVTMPYQPSFHAYGNNGMAASSTKAVIVWPTIRHNIGGHYNASTGYFTAPVSGLYHFGFCTIAANNDSVYRMFPYVNGAKQGDMHLRIDTSASGSEYGENATYSFTFYLSANDTLSIWGSNDSALEWYASGSTTNDYYRFWGYLIG